MEHFDYKDIYVEDGRRVLEINILPEKYCNFDCIFCPIGRSANKVDAPVTFDAIDRCLKELEKKIDETGAEMVFINSKGEAMIHNRIVDVIDFIKEKGLLVRLLTNGYLLGRKEYMGIANRCDEVIGEFKMVTEEDFQKVQRPIEGYTLEEYTSNMVNFQKQYKGIFILEVTIIKGYNDTAVDRIREAVCKIAPDRLVIARIEDERFRKKLGVLDDEFEVIAGTLAQQKNLKE